MDSNEVLKQMTEIFKSVMDNDDIVLNNNTTAADIEEWDSITHIQLIVAVEKHFKIKFSSTEIRAFKNVGELCQTVKAKLG